MHLKSQHTPLFEISNTQKSITSVDKRRYLRYNNIENVNEQRCDNGNNI